MKVLVIGSGGREHALVWKISQSPKVDKIYCAPGNAGISKLAECISISPSDLEGLKFFVQQNDIDLTIVGPELPLVCGIVNEFKKLGLRIFGPEFAAAQLEGSKIFAKRVMKTLNIPTAEFLLFDDARIAKSMIGFMDKPVVVKADGLAAGKGVFVCKGKEDAIEAIDKIMVQKIFGDAGRFIVAEKIVEGHEVSFMAFTDGKSIATMPAVIDQKTMYNGGPNTGGVAASSFHSLKEEVQDHIMNKVLAPLISGLANQGIKYRGVIYVGLKGDISSTYNFDMKVLEFNVRFGDPECQVLMSLLETDLIDIIEAIEEERLNEIEIKWKSDHASTIALISEGYPGKYEVGHEIFGLDREYPNHRFPNTYIFHGGTKIDDNKIVTNGGRVLYITSVGDNDTKDNELVIEDIDFEGKNYRGRDKEK